MRATRGGSDVVVPRTVNGESPRPRRGRRPKTRGSARDDILRAAQHLFTEQGLEQTSLRAIARGAGVDPALVLHYFSGKEELFFDLLRPTLRSQVSGVLPPGPLPRGIGGRIVKAFVTVWDQEGRGLSFAAMARSTGTKPRTARAIRRLLLLEVTQLLSGRLHPNELAGRVGLVASQLLGLGMARYVLRFEPVASASAESLAKAIGPTLDRYLLDRTILDPPSASAGPRGPERSRVRSIPRRVSVALSAPAA